MSRTTIRELVDGASVNEVYLLADKQLRANRNANLYLLSTLRDRTGIISGLMWNVTEDSVRHIQTGDLVRVRGKVQVYQGGLQMIVTQIDQVSPNAFDSAEFEPEPLANVEALLAELNAQLDSMADPALKTLLQLFLADEKVVSALSSAPAGVKTHHAYHGGLLEHVVSMMRLASFVGGHYEELDRDLLLAGVFLHDLGKVRELSWEPTLAYTDEGQLLGHMHIAVEILNEKLAQLQEIGNFVIDAETELRLKHLILSHHGSLEFGSPRVPMTIEAIALHYIDNLDAKVHEFTRLIADDLNEDSSWTPYSHRLERRLFKGTRQPQ